MSAPIPTPYAALELAALVDEYRSAIEAHSAHHNAGTFQTMKYAEEKMLRALRATQGADPGQPAAGLKEKAIREVLATVDLSERPVLRSLLENALARPSQGPTVKESLTVAPVPACPDCGEPLVPYCYNALCPRNAHPVPAAPAAPVDDRDESGWLLEYPGLLYVGTEPGKQLDRTKDHNKAIRFARKEDAQAMFDALCWILPGFFQPNDNPPTPVEHVWVKGAPPPVTHYAGLAAHPGSASTGEASHA